MQGVHGNRGTMSPKRGLQVGSPGSIHSTTAGPNTKPGGNKGIGIAHSDGSNSPKARQCRNCLYYHITSQSASPLLRNLVSACLFVIIVMLRVSESVTEVHSCNHCMHTRQDESPLLQGKASAGGSSQDRHSPHPNAASNSGVYENDNIKVRSPVSFNLLSSSCNYWGESEHAWQDRAAPLM